MHAPSSQPSTVVGGGVVQVVHQAWTALLPMCPTSRWHNALPLMPSTEARLGCAPLSSSMARPTFLMHGLPSLKSPAHRLGQHADTALVGSGTTSHVAGGAGCVEQTLATNELLLNHHASCTMQSRKTVPQPASGLGQGGGLALVINRDHDVLASATIHWNQVEAAKNRQEPARVQSRLPQHRPLQDPRFRRPGPSPAWHPRRSAAAHRRPWLWSTPAGSRPLPNLNLDSWWLCVPLGSAPPSRSWIHVQSEDGVESPSIKSGTL